MRNVNYHALTFFACVLSMLFPHGVLSREKSRLDLRFRSLESRLDDLSAVTNDVALLRLDRAGAGHVPASAQSDSRTGGRVLPWRSFHACGSWGADTGSRRLYVGQNTAYGRIVDLGSTYVVFDDGTVASLSSTIPPDSNEVFND